MKSIIKLGFMDKSYRTELRRVFLIEVLPEPLTRSSSHIQIFDNYIANTRLRLRSVRQPETKEWTHIIQQRFPASVSDASNWKIAEIYLNETEYAHFQQFEGDEIRKNRYFHEFDGFVMLFDVYLGELWGLNTVKVEFETEKELARFMPPPFAVFEITQNHFFFGETLVTKTFADIKTEVGELAGELPVAFEKQEN